MELTHRFMAETSLIGMGIDVLGGCYLAYDLLGGKRGPLRIFARAIGYIVLFYAGYGILLGWRYAAAASVGMGILLALEFRKPLEVDKLGKFHKHIRIFTYGLLRGVILGLASTSIASITFAVIFGLLSAIGLAATYFIGFAPVRDYSSEHKPRFTQHKILSSLWRAVAVSVAGLVAGYFSDSGQWAMELKLGCAAGVVSALVSLFSPPLEWWVENLPDRRLGLFGIILIFIGMLLQSAQYWVVVLDMTVN
jgi:hypothetical protein